MKKLDKPYKNKLLFQIIVLKNIFTAFQKTSEAEEILKEIESDKEDNKFKRIRCPLCKWSPTSSSLWLCSSWEAPEFFNNGCGTIWNTFETRGKCPGCSHQWRWTSCLRCAGWSRHEDWYESENR